MVKYLVLALFLCASISVYTQQSSLAGFVNDSQTELPMVGAELILEPGKMISISTEMGAYLFENVPKGHYTLKVSHLGYKTVEFELDIKSQQSVRLDIILLPAAETLEEIVIRDFSEHNKISHLPYLESFFLQKEIHETAANDVGEFLRGAANINGIRKGGTNIDPVIRGFKFSQLNVMFNNGQKVEGGCPNRMDPATAHIETEDIERIQVIKGPYMLQYGPAFGGLINLKKHTLPFKPKGLVHVHAGQSFETNGSGQKGFVRMYGNYKQLFYQVSGGQVNYGNYTDGAGREVSSSFARYKYGGLIGISPWKGHYLSIDYTASKSSDFRFPSLPMDERRDDTRLVSLDYVIERKKKNLQQVEFKLYNSKVNHEMDNKYRPFSDTVVAVSIIDAINQGGRAHAHWIFESSEFYAGVDFENIQKDGERIKSMIKQPGLPVRHEKLWNNAAINNVGFHVGYEKNIKDWKFILSGRLDKNMAKSDAIVIMHPGLGEIYHFHTDSISSDFTNLSFSLGIDRKLSEKLKLSLAAGRGVRSPDILERFIILLPIGYDQFDYLGNPMLNPEKNFQVDLTLTRSCQRSGVIQINGFYSLVNNYITGKRLPPSQQKPLSKDVLGVKQFYNADRARLRGFEFVYLTPERNNWGASLGASYTYGTLDKVEQYVLNENQQVVDDLELSNDALTEIPPLEVNLKAHYKFIEGTLVPQISARFVASQKHVSLASYEQESPGFVVAGLNLNYRINSLIRVVGGVKNIFDIAYYEHLNRNIIGSSTSLYEPGRSFFLTVLIDL